uniref:Androgen-induced 1 n=1 Tax=Mus spicilegus TaxID=10103 RepID=A0A8C6HCP0_MUSSI
ALPPWRPGVDLADRLGGARPVRRTPLQNDADDARDDTRPPARVGCTAAPPAQVSGALGAATVPGDAPRLLRSAPRRAAPRFPRRPAPRSSSPALPTSSPAGPGRANMALVPCQVLRVAILLSYCSILCNYKAIEMPSHQTYGGSWKFLTFIDLDCTCFVMWGVHMCNSGQWKIL